VGRLVSRRPSDLKTGTRLVGFSEKGGGRCRRIRHQGHALFETVEWWDSRAVPAWTAARRNEGGDEAAIKEALGVC